MRHEPTASDDWDEEEQGEEEQGEEERWGMCERVCAGMCARV